MRARNWAIAGGMALLVGGGALGQWVRTAPPVGPPAAALRVTNPAVPQVLGDPAAPVLVEEYGDFQCPACGAFERSAGPALKQLAAARRIRLAYYPIGFLGKESVTSAGASLCAANGGRFWEYHDLLYAQQAPENSGALSIGRLLGLGELAGVKDPQFSLCVSSARYAGLVQQVTDAASRRGVSSTPTIYVSGKRLPSPSLQAVLAAVDATSP